MVYSRRIESLWPSAGVAMRGMAREYAAGDSRGLGWREFAGTFGCPLGGPVAGRPSGGEWNGSQPGQGATELGFPGPALWQMQGEAACRAGEPSGQGEEPPPEGLGGYDLLTQTVPRRPAGQVALIAELSDGRTISVPLCWYPRLVHGTPKERDNWELIGTSA